MYFFDTYAMIEVLLSNQKYRPYLGFPFTVSVLNIGELYIYMARTYGRAAAMGKMRALSFNVVELTKEIMMAAADFKLANSKKKLSWADCAGYVSARRLNLKFLTGDSQFKGVPNVEFVK